MRFHYTFFCLHFVFIKTKIFFNAAVLLCQSKNIFCFKFSYKIKLTKFKHKLN